MPSSYEYGRVYDRKDIELVSLRRENEELRALIESLRTGLRLALTVIIEGDLDAEEK